MSASAWGFIGTFSAPGTGEVGVLGIELEHDFDTGMKSGVVRLETRPYWEGGATPFALEMPATSNREAMHLTGLWIERGLYDGEGCCNITVTGVKVQIIPATPTLDESTDPSDLDWHELRSACHRRDWRAAWEVIGTDHEGDATPGEVYLFGVARQARAVSATLWHWRELRERVVPLAKGNLSWQRIKGIAAWQSQAAAQYVKPAPKVYRIDSPGVGFDMRMISTPHGPGLFERLAGRMSFGDEGNPLDVLREIQRTTQDVRTMPSEIWISPETYAAVQRARMEQAQGIAGVLSNPFMSRVRVVPQAMMPTTQPEVPRAQRRRRK